jgi:hypothetical protein
MAARLWSSRIVQQCLLLMHPTIPPQPATVHHHPPLFQTHLPFSADSVTLNPACATLSLYQPLLAHRTTAAAPIYYTLVVSHSLSLQHCIKRPSNRTPTRQCSSIMHTTSRAPVLQEVCCWDVRSQTCIPHQQLLLQESTSKLAVLAAAYPVTLQCVSAMSSVPVSFMSWSAARM